MSKVAGCELCEGDGGVLVLANECLRVVLVDDASFPGFVRVIWNEHVREMTELTARQRGRLMDTVFAVEAAQHEVLSPVKINLASLGNLTPHLHWHVIPRYRDDSHFPQPIWGVEQRSPAQHASPAQRERLDQLRRMVAEKVSRVAQG